MSEHERGAVDRAEKRARLDADGEGSVAAEAVDSGKEEGPVLARSKTLPLGEGEVGSCHQCWQPLFFPPSSPSSSSSSTPTSAPLVACALCHSSCHASCLSSSPSSLCQVCFFLSALPAPLYGGTLLCGAEKKNLSFDIAALSAALSSAEEKDRFLANVARLTEKKDSGGAEVLAGGAEVLIGDAACVSWDGDRAENQDVGFCSNSNSALQFFCVFDGHGMGGQIAAHFGAADLIRRCVIHRLTLAGKKSGEETDFFSAECVAQSMRNAFRETQMQLLQLLQEKNLECGSTVVMATIVKSQIVVANVGDSRALLIRRKKNVDSPARNEDTGEKKEEKKTDALNCESVALSVDHSFSRADECKRIVETSKGEIVIGAGNMMRVMPGGGFPREEIKRQALALNMTRAIGHPVLSQYGVSPEPEITITDVGAGDVIILASDGLWDVLENDEVAQISNSKNVKNSRRNSAKKVAQSLLVAARDKYQKNRQRNGRADNTTIIAALVSAPGEDPPAPDSQPE